MNALLVYALLVGVAPTSGSRPAAAGLAGSVFSVVTATSTTGDDFVPCLAGKLEAGRRVELLPSKGAETCEARTGAVTQATTGAAACTSLRFTKTRCESAGHFLAVASPEGVGFEPHRRVKVEAPAALEQAAAAVRASGLLSALRADRANRVERGVPIAAATLVEAYTFPELAVALTFLRYRMTARDPASVLSPVFVVLNGKASAPFGHCSSEPTVFSVAGETYVHAAASCCECGRRQDLVYAIGATLEPVYESWALSN